MVIALQGGGVGENLPIVDRLHMSRMADARELKLCKSRS